MKYVYIYMWTQLTMFYKNRNKYKFIYITKNLFEAYLFEYDL